MNVASVNLAGVLTPAIRYIIPLFQRDYVWKRPDWENLWDDVTELLKSDSKTSRHFMGTIVFVPQQPIPGLLPSYEVIDGQQRLVSLTLLLCAIRNVAKRSRFDSLVGEISYSYLTHQFKENDGQFRLLPRWRDREQYKAAIKSKPVTTGSVLGALDYFTKQIESEDKVLTELQLRRLFETITTQLQFVQINLEKGENPFQIFKSLNSTGVELAESDLIRNFVFMQVPEQDREQFDTEFWVPLEAHFIRGDGKNKGELDGRAFSGFLRDFLMMHGNYVGVHSTYEHFEAFCIDKSDAATIVRELDSHVQVYDIILGIKGHPLGNGKLQNALKQLRQFEASTSFPLVLNLINRLEKGILSVDEVITAIRLIAGFVVRRYVCNLTSRTYGKWFVAGCAALKENPVENLREFLINKGFPTDAEFQEAFVEFELYKGSDGRYALNILKALEASYGHKEMPDFSKAGIEHIMPQKLTTEWESSVGPHDGLMHGKWKHTPGNLTLTAYNGQLAQKSFLAKRAIYGDSHFVLTKNLKQISAWGESQIRARGKALAEKASDIWAGPFS